MNIFRILAQGDGSINEPNISAFLGYLLNPNEDHGLGSYFLEQFLEQHFVFCDYFNESKNAPLHKDSLYNSLNDNYPISSKYEIKIFFEQAFKDPNKKEKKVVDIILLMYKIASDGKTETQFINYLKKDRDLEHIFLIEVKVKDSSAQVTSGEDADQLEAQIENSRDILRNILKEKNMDLTDSDVDKKISAIFVSQGSDSLNSQKAFLKSFNKKEIKSIPKSHIFWSKPKKSNYLKEVYEINELKLCNSNPKQNIENEQPSEWRSIQDILNESILSNSFKQIAIPTYTIDTIKSFSDFINSDFSYKLKKASEQGDYLDFEDFAKNNFSYLGFDNQDLIVDLYNNILEFYKSNKDLNQLIKFTKTTISFKYPNYNIKTFHFSFKLKNKLEVYYCSESMIPFTGQIKHVSAERKGRLNAWLLTCELNEENYMGLIQYFNRSNEYIRNVLSNT